MTQRIHHLDSLTIDQIAAGEVIDVPASCVKELVENSLDAGATDIVVEIGLGGRELIRVTDNGAGMGRDDVIASIERHSTSKLRDITDLERLSSRGFRGEALASIVAIAHVTMTSAEKEGSLVVCPATTLEVEGGKILSIVDTRAPQGTSIEVTSLFFNVPARRKFLKSPAKDSSDIIKTMTSLALAAPHVSFRLIVDGRQVLVVSKEEEPQLSSRIRSLLKEPFGKGSFEVHHVRDGCSLIGLIADPRHARSTRAGQYLIVNGRPVQSFPISYAVKGAFGTTCEEKKHPLFVLHLTIDPSSVDVNVHPQKREVRFADEEWVRMIVQEGISEALFGKKNFSSIRDLDFASDMMIRPAYEQERGFSHWNPMESEEALSLIPVAQLESPPCSPICIAVMGDVALIQHGDIPGSLIPFSNDSLLVIDLKQALRSVVVRELESSIQEVTTELLLIPVPLECSLQEASVLLMHLPQLEKLGCLIRPFGPQSFLIEGVPTNFSGLDLPKFILDLVHEGVISNHHQMKEEKNKRLANAYVATMKDLRHPISSETALSIFRRWAQHDFPRLSPDGCPCFLQLTQTELKELISKGSFPTIEKQRR